MEFINRKIGQNKKNKKNHKWLFYLIVLVLIIGAYFGFKEYQYRYLIEKTASEDTKIYTFEIKEGELPKIVGQNLENNGFIVSGDAFFTYSKRSGLGSQFQAGRFYLTKNLTIPDLAQKLTLAEPDKITITFPEGFTISEIDARLAGTGLINEGDFIDCVKETCDFSAYDFLPKNRDQIEGFLFPDTYFIYPQSFSAQDFAGQMLNNFKNRTQDFWPDIEKNGRTLLETVIMASIVEKETHTGAERPIVADLFWRRLDNGISLGADATVRYLTNNKTDDITYDDLQIDSPYNTRKNLGLPPTAITNPGLESLKATIYPSANDYWYFLHDKDGIIHYATTLTEHNINKQNYL